MTIHPQAAQLRVPTKIYFAVVILGALITAAGAVYYYQNQQQLREQKHGELASIAELKVNRLTAWHRERLGNAGVLAGNPVLADLIRQYLSQPGNSMHGRELSAWLEAVRKSYDYSAVILVDRTGQPRLSAGPGDARLGPQEVEATRKAIREQTVQMLDLHLRDDGQACLAMIAPTPDGAVIARVEAERFLYPYIQGWPVPSQTAETLLVRREGQEAVFLNRLRHHPGAALRLRMPLDDATLVSAAGALGREGIFEGRDYRGEPVLAAVRRVPGTPWVLVAKVDQEEIYAPLRDRARSTLAAVILLTGLGAMAMGLLWQRREMSFFSERYEAERHRRALAARYEQLMRSANDAVLLIGRDGAIREVNDRAVLAYGYGREELAGSQLRELYFDPQQADLNGVWRSSESEEGLIFETVYRRKDGSPVPVEVSTRVIGVDRERLRLSIVRDITERKRAEAELRKLNRTLRLLSDCNQTLIRATGEQELLDRICGMIVELGGYRAACVALGAEAPRVAAWAGPARDDAPGRELAARAIRAGDAVIEHGIPGCAAALALPLRVEGAAIGGLAIFSAGRDAFDPQEMELLLEMAGDLSFGIQTLRSQAEKERTTEALARAQAIASLGSFEIDAESGEAVWSEETYRIFGVDRAAFRPTRENTLAALVESDRERVREAVGRMTASGAPLAVETRVRRPDGVERHVRILCETAAGRISGTVQDITEYRRLEEQFLQAQKLETVGQLAGGVAHDFNNLLTVINGYCDLLLEQTGPGSAIHSRLVEIRRAGEQAATLTGQLLAFSRKQMRQPVALDLNQAVGEIEEMLRRLLGEQIDLRTELGPALATVLVDPAHMHQVLLNLAVNARDAMPEGGKLIIETANVDLDEQYAAEHPEVTPGPYVMVAVSDTGAGMTEEIRSRIFEPFFTTKPKGTGTGLGLATVYGIVKQNNGSIWVYSEPGRGTTFKVYLPVFSGLEAPARRETRVSRGAGGAETVLVVEDLAELRALAGIVLESYGYRVLQAAGGEEAMEIAGRYEGVIHLLLSDVIMPGMAGRELARRLHASRPGMRVLYMSGYTENVIAHHGVLDAGVAYVQKPFSPGGLAAQVRAVLDAEA